jgi:hypothetical protein
MNGLPNTDGLFQFAMQFADSYEIPNTVVQNYQIRISDPMTITGPGFVQILYNQSYSTTFPASGGFPPYTWSMTEVIPGFTLDGTTGTLSGAPLGVSYASTSPIVIVHDSSNPPLTATYYFFTLEVWGKLSILTSSLPTIANGSPTWLTPVFTGGAFTSPYSLSISSGSLPPGMALSPTSAGTTITGTPTSAGVYSFNLSVSDGNTGNLHQAASQPLALTVKDRGQMTRNDTNAQATALSNIILLASISPFSDPGSAGPDVDVYSMSAAPGTIVQVYVNGNNDFQQPPEPNSLQPVIEIVDQNGNRYQTCALPSSTPGPGLSLPCVNGLPGTNNIQGADFSFLVPGTGPAPVTFYVRVSDARGDARPDFIYTFSVNGVN